MTPQEQFRQLNAGFITNLDLCDHTVPTNAREMESKLCESCGRTYLRLVHQPQYSERELLLALVLWGDEPKMYAKLKRELLNLRGPRYCMTCISSYVPVSQRS